jgi:hypothetical protein
MAALSDLQLLQASIIHQVVCKLQGSLVRPRIALAEAISQMQQEHIAQQQQQQQQQQPEVDVGAETAPYEEEGAEVGGTEPAHATTTSPAATGPADASAPEETDEDKLLNKVERLCANLKEDQDLHLLATEMLFHIMQPMQVGVFLLGSFPFLPDAQVGGW